MPIYEYECTKCAEIEEVIQKFSDKPLVKCKRCGGKLNKLISHSSFHLKGTGWYVTDYANKSKKNSGAANNAPKAQTSQTSNTSASNKNDKPSSEGSAD
jgi:putative FmdB family regulatory protein